MRGAVTRSKTCGDVKSTVLYPGPDEMKSVQLTPQAKPLREHNK